MEDTICLEEKWSIMLFPLGRIDSEKIEIKKAMLNALYSVTANRGFATKHSQ